MKQKTTLITHFYMSTTSALSCFDALAKHICTAHCFHSELVIIPAKLNIFCTLQKIPLTTLVLVSSPRRSGSKVANGTASNSVTGITH